MESIKEFDLSLSEGLPKKYLNNDVIQRIRRIMLEDLAYPSDFKSIHVIDNELFKEDFNELLELEPSIDLDFLLSQINKYFNYRLDSGYYHKPFLKKLTVENVLRYKKKTTPPPLDYFIDNLILRCYALKELAQRAFEIENINEGKKLTIFDFNKKVLSMLSIEALIDIVKNKYLEGESDACYELLQKCQRIDKLYIVDNLDINSHEKFNLKLNREFFEDILVYIKSISELINNKTFDKLASNLLNIIEEELNLIEIIVKINRMYLDHNLTPEQAWKISQKLQYGYFDIDDSFKQLSPRQICLLKQVLSGIIVTNKNPTYTEEFISFCKDFLKMFDKVKCYEKPIIHCWHDTFQYYTLNKWMKVFCKVFSSYFGDCRFKTIINANFFDFIYPKKGFCSSCYIEYKGLEKVKSLKEIETKFIAYKASNKLLFYRSQFADKCDTEPNSGHFIEIFGIKQTTKTILDDILLSLRAEIKNIKRGFI